MLKTITFEIETITPMFLAGADQSKAELRAASIKGLLRFWWRALQTETDLVKLRNRESQIFGAPDEKIGGSSFSIRITYNGTFKGTTSDLPKHNIVVTSQSRGKTFPVNILEYLAYGPCTYDKHKKKNLIIREYIQSGFKFKIHMTIIGEKFLNEILRAMYVFDLFGGIGSKSRNGFGSFSISNKDECFRLLAERFSRQDDRYSKSNLLSFVKQTDNNSYTSFVTGTMVFKTKGLHDKWDGALAEAGKIYREARLSIEGKHNFKSRQFIGAPLDPPNEPSQFKSLLDRHAKPYFMKVVKEGNQYRSYILYLPSLYCAGLDEDRNKNRIKNHDELNNKFTEVCNEFNNFLGKHMETIL